jgi:LPS export ABC transporter protein LptC
LTLALAGVGALLLACSLKPGLAERPDSLESLAPIELEGVVFEGFTNGTRGLRVEAERASIDAVGAHAQLFEVGIAFAGSERGDVQIRSRRAALDLGREDAVLEGGVDGQTRAGERFRTETLRYDRAAAELVSDGPVRLERENLDVEAEGMRLDLEGRRLVLRGGVRTRLSPGGEAG